jgi:hypothetical protein
MKKFILIVIIGAFFTSLASAQTNFLPDYAAGIKGGADYSMFPGVNNVHNKNQFGYIGGFWGRFGGQGLFFQPELYYAARNVFSSEIHNGVYYTDNAKFTSVDIPLLIGSKSGDAKFGFRFYTGPVLSLAITKHEDFLNSSIPTHYNYKDENYSWQLGAGIDVNAFSIDIRYEAGINGVPYGSNPTTTHTRLNMVNVTLAYSLFTDYN